MNTEKIKPLIESLLFINEKPIEVSELCEVIEVSKKDIEIAMQELISEYKQRQSGICIIKVAGGYQMCSTPENEPWIKRMYHERTRQKLSTASLETLAIIAYKQPITRIEMEAIRGVNIDGVLKKLSDLGLIKIAGRKDVIGKPFIYITTRKFLEYFGINALKDLPKLEEFVALAEKDNIINDSSNSEVNPNDNKEGNVGNNTSNDANNETMEAKK